MRHKDRAHLARTTVILAKVLNGAAPPKEGFFRGALVKRP